MPVLDFCKNIIGGEHVVADYSEEISKLRKVTDKKQRDKIKSTLPCVTVSGTFKPVRAKSNLIEHSGFICIDIDKKGNPEINDWPALRDSLATIQNTLFIALSASAQGIFIVIPISNPNQHENHFRALEIDFKDIGIAIDTSCKDVSRLRGMSFDPDGILNFNAIPYRRVYTPPAPKSVTHSSNSLEIDNLAAWAAKKVPFVTGSRHEFIKQFAGALHRFGIDRATAEAAAMKYQQPDFKENEILNIINWIYKDNSFYGASLNRTAI
jgi:hypothetical protein